LPGYAPTIRVAAFDEANSSLAWPLGSLLLVSLASFGCVLVAVKEVADGVESCHGGLEIYALLE
jgi:hypothetical protein